MLHVSSPPSHLAAWHVPVLLQVLERARILLDKFTKKGYKAAFLELMLSANKDKTRFTELTAAIEAGVNHLLRKQQLAPISVKTQYVADMKGVADKVRQRYQTARLSYGPHAHPFPPSPYPMSLMPLAPPPILALSVLLLVLLLLFILLHPYHSPFLLPLPSGGGADGLQRGPTGGTS
jgi:hypothetical protein